MDNPSKQHIQHIQQILQTAPECPDLGEKTRSHTLPDRDPETVRPAPCQEDGTGGDTTNSEQETLDRILGFIEKMNIMKEINKPILSVKEAAVLLSVSPKRMSNIISQERQRLGRMPDFVCDAGGVLSNRILRDQLLDWARNRARVRRARKAVPNPISRARGRSRT